MDALVVGFPVIPLTRGAMVRISLTAAHTTPRSQRLLESFRRWLTASWVELTHAHESGRDSPRRRIVLPSRRVTVSRSSRAARETVSRVSPRGSTATTRTGFPRCAKANGAARVPAASVLRAERDPDVSRSRGGRGLRAHRRDSQPAHHRALPRAARVFRVLRMPRRSAGGRRPLSAACEWLAARGLPLVRGPASPSINYMAGVLVEGFDSPPTFCSPTIRPTTAR